MINFAIISKESKISVVIKNLVRNAYLLSQGGIILSIDNAKSIFLIPKGSVTPVWHPL